VVTLDLTGEGHPDIALVQNSHAPTPSLGRFTGGLGLVLLNDGLGNFQSLDPAMSGLVVPGDAKALVVTDLNQDGWPDLVASRNDQPALGFRHHGLAGRRPLRILLQGPPGNPTGIGARLTLTLADGSAQTAAISAGGGYYSQSSPAVCFSYPATSTPRSLAVSWPDGHTSTRKLDPGTPATISVGWDAH
ncbi:MAG TPA: CRTAC1 family protein, partial [Lacunisphaera sp.]